MGTEDIFFALLRGRINGKNIDEEVKNSITLETLSALYRLSKKQDLGHLVGDALEKIGLLKEAPQAEAEKEAWTAVREGFLRERDKAVYRYEQMQYELDEMTRVLRAAGIPFMPLKGAVLRSLYPEPWMRTSCDIDVLVKEEHLQAAISALTGELEYSCEGISDHDAQLYAPSGVHLELHYTLDVAIATPAEKEYFSHVWEHDEGSADCCRRMSDEDFYCFFIVHTARHAREGGCGVRPFMDIWLMNHMEGVDFAARAAAVEQVGLSTFARAAEHLSEVWFGDAEPTPMDEALEEYVLTGGVYGSVQNRVAAKTGGGQSKFAYIASRIFLPYSEMKYKYPRLQKYPILLPFYEVKRWFNLLQKDRREKSVRELRETTGGDRQRKDRVVQLLEELGL